MTFAPSGLPEFFRIESPSCGVHGGDLITHTCGGAKPLQNFPPNFTFGEGSFSWKKGDSVIGLRTEVSNNEDGDRDGAVKACGILTVEAARGLDRRTSDLPVFSLICGVFHPFGMTAF